MLRAIAVAMIVSLVSIPCLARETTPNVDDNLDALGCARDFSDTLKPPKLRVTCDQATVLRRAADLQKLGVIDAALTGAEVEARPVTIAGIVLMQAIAMALPDIYRTTDDNGVAVEGFISSVDDRGHHADHLAYSFGFDRALSKRTDWDRFDPAKAPRSAKRFIASHWFRSASASEK